MSRTTSLNGLRALLAELDRYAIFVTTAAFTLAAVAVRTGGLVVPGGFLTLALYPAVLFAIPISRPHLYVGPELRGAAGWSALALTALWLSPFLIANPQIAISVPIVLAAAVAAAKAPAAATIAAALLAACIGSFQALTDASPSALIDLLLAAIWLAVLGRIVSGRPAGLAAWPAVLGCGLFFGLSTVDLLTSKEFGIAFVGFKSTIWYMIAFIAIGYAGWTRETYRRVALGLTLITVAVASYAVLRWIIGPSGVEEELARVTASAINVDPIDGSLRVVGSFQTAHQMAFWSAFMGPFALAVALWARGKWRLIAFAAVLLSLLAVVASEVRGPAPGFVGGVLLVLLIHQVSRAFPAMKATVAAIVVVASLLLGGGVVLATSSDSERVERFGRILDPESDQTFQQRQLKWAAILDSVAENPFGRGLGTAGAAQATSGEELELAAFNIDNSYLKIAYEQGLAVMVIFIAAMVGLLGSIAFAAARTTSPESAAFGMGACGALFSVLISFYSGLFIESATIVTAWIVVGLGVARLVDRSSPPQTEATNG